MTSHRRLVLMALPAVLLAGCADSASDGEGASPTSTAVASVPEGAGPGCGDDGSAEPGRSVVEVTSGGRERSYVRYVPEGAAPDRPAPVVLDLTAYSPASMQEAFSGWTTDDGEGSTKADDVGAVVLTPEPLNGEGLLTWNIDGTEGWTDDDAFLIDVLDDAAASVCTDADRVLVSGFALGGVMASRFACDHADRVTSVAAVAGLWDPPGCDPSAPVPVIAFHGDDDHFLPFEGGIGDRVGELGLTAETSEGLVAMADRPGAVDASQAWAERNGCQQTPGTAPGGSGTEVREWAGCRAGAEVVLHILPGGSHTWPGSTGMAAYEGLLGPVSGALDATDLSWTFFEGQARR